MPCLPLLAMPCAHLHPKAPCDLSASISCGKVTEHVCCIPNEEGLMLERPLTAESCVLAVQAGPMGMSAPSIQLS